MKLIDNWQRWYRMFSVQMLLLAGAIQSVLAVLTPEQAAGIVPFTTATTWAGLGAGVTIVVAVLGAVGRLVDQGAVVDPSKAPQ